MSADQAAWNALADAHRSAPRGELEPTDDPVRERARAELNRDPSPDEYFAVAAGRPAADAHQPPPERKPRPDDPLPGERPEDVFARLARGENS